MHAPEEKGKIPHQKYDQLFQSTSYYYARFRPPYPENIFEAIIKHFDLKKGDKILDLGCGTGHISIPFARYGFKVHGVDPSHEMLAEAIRLESREAHYGIQWTLGSDETLANLMISNYRVCTMGASFHWTNRELLLEYLYENMVFGDGIVVISGVQNPWSKNTSTWQRTIKEIIQDFLGKERLAGVGRYNHPQKRHEEVIECSKFGKPEIIKYKTIITQSVEEIIGLQLSTSYASSALLGERKQEFINKLKDELLYLNPNGEFITEYTYEIILAKRDK